MFDMSQMRFQADQPYPEIAGIRCNPVYANVLLDDYAGFVSETQAVLQYMYQHYVLSNCEEQIAGVLEKIGTTEMHHHEIVGKTIIALGGNPMYHNSCHRYFDGRYINYSNHFVKMIVADLEGEKQTIAGYEKRICIIKDPVVQKILARIIEDEQVHIMTLSSILQQCGR